jgi:hypothetical protein
MISRVCLAVTSGAGVPVCGGRLREEFPTIAVEHARSPNASAVAISASDWSSAHAFDPFDRAMRNASSAVAVCGDARSVDGAALEVLTRYQRFIERRNAYSRGGQFDRLLEHHRAAHDLTKPLVAADFEHALDAWQWMLRIEPDASAAAQMAALLHHVEHARAMLAQADVDGRVAERVAFLIAHHEKPDDDPEVRLLADADALSFFSLNSEAYLRYFGPAQTRRKVAYSFARLRARHRRRLREMRLMPEIARDVAGEMERCGA